MQSGANSAWCRQALSLAIPALWEGKAGRWVEIEKVPIEFPYLLHVDSELSAGGGRDD